jgi:hypothetical protein
LFASIQAFGQEEQPTGRRGSTIVDDSTRQVYGPKTSRYFLERDVFMNRLVYHNIDTVINNLHRFTYVQRNNYLYQDLGNIGTAIQPIYYQTPDNIGATPGFRSYDLYWDTEAIRNYDTKSPYTNMYVILGGKGRSITRASFSRNINPRWNFGFNFRSLLIDKQVQRQSKGDRNVRSTYYDVYTSFQSKDSTYRIFANLRRNKLEADEYGGIRPTEGFVYSDYFLENAQPNLLEASSSDLRMNGHLYHQYEVGKALQVYHIFDRYRQANQFLDSPELAPEDYYDHVEVPGDTTDDYSKFITVRNEVGVKGNISKIFYNGYYAIRDFRMSNKYTVPDSIRVEMEGVESYLGGRIGITLDSLFEVTGWAELQQSGNYRIEGQIKSRWAEVSLKQLQYATPLLLQTYRGSHDVWYNDFGSTNVTQINGYLHYRSKVLQVSPGLTFTRLGNYAYFKQGDYGPDEEQTVLPVQTASDIVIVRPELRFGLTMAKHIQFSSRVVYTNVLKNPDAAIQVPELFVNAQLSYANIFFDGNLDMHGGFDLHYASSYYAMAYDVPTQQFYIQQAYKPPAFPIVDVFFNAKINRAMIFFKYNNLIQLFTQEGYMPTPDYIGQRNIFDFGVDWSFYD